MLNRTIITSLLIAVSASAIVYANAPVQALNSTYGYVPQMVKPAAGYSNKQQQQQLHKSLTKVQQQGITDTAGLSQRILKRVNPDSADYRSAEQIAARYQKQVKQQYQMLAAKYHNQHPQQPHLYYFISFSMPMPLIKSYMLDAIWNGGVLVLRGVEPGETLSQFFQHYLIPLVKYKGNHARIEINPNLFEQYGITKVPTMVIATHSTNLGCDVVLTDVPGTKVPYQRCAPVSSDTYWKISGNVGSRWALRHLKAAGAPAQLFLDRMANRGGKADQTERPFVGNWQTAPMPFSDSTIEQVLKEHGYSQDAHGAIGAVQVIRDMSQTVNE